MQPEGSLLCLTQPSTARRASYVYIISALFSLAIPSSLFLLGYPTKPLCELYVSPIPSSMLAQ